VDYRALQCDLFAVSNGYNVGYLLTVVEAERQWYALVAQATKSRFRLARGEMGEIAMSFRVL
jgi:hypothetical protein